MKKNWEFYEKEVKETNGEFGLIDGKIISCDECKCDKCLFTPEITGVNCFYYRINWLYSKYVKPVMLTENEILLCRLLKTGWITRDKNGLLCYYQSAPPVKKTQEGRWVHSDDTTEIMVIHSRLIQCEFNFIEWEDEEPWEVRV